VPSWAHASETGSDLVAQVFAVRQDRSSTSLAERRHTNAEAYSEGVHAVGFSPQARLEELANKGVAGWCGQGLRQPQSASSGQRAGQVGGAPGAGGGEAPEHEACKEHAFAGRDIRKTPSDKSSDGKDAGKGEA